MQVLSDLVIGQSLGSQQDHLSPSHLKIGQRIFIGSPVKLASLGLGQSDLIGAFLRHFGQPFFVMTTLVCCSWMRRRTSRSCDFSVDTGEYSSTDLATIVAEILTIRGRAG